MGLTACVPRGTDSDGAHLTAGRLPIARVGVLTWNRRPQAMPGRGPRTCGRGPRAAPEQATRAGTLAEPEGTRARNAWGRALAEPGRRWPAA